MKKEDIEKAAREYADGYYPETNYEITMTAGLLCENRKHNFYQGAEWMQSQNKNEAIEFAEWIVGSKYDSVYCDIEKKMVFVDIPTESSYEIDDTPGFILIRKYKITTQELFEMFKEQR